MVKQLLFGLLLVIFIPFTQAGEAVPTSDDPVLEKKVMTLSENLRCLVCQNQTIADSNAELAVDLRNQVREKLKAGQSEEDILKYMVARYGDFVLFKPQMKTSTWLLWFGPLIMLIGGVWVLTISLRQRRKLQLQAHVLSAEEHERAEILLSDKIKKSDVSEDTAQTNIVQKNTKDQS
ncbi:MAG: cytochrome c-type biogenesis protein [Candidatus Nitrotoga sp.]